MHKNRADHNAAMKRICAENQRILREAKIRLGIPLDRRRKTPMMEKQTVDQQGT